MALTERVKEQISSFLDKAATHFLDGQSREERAVMGAVNKVGKPFFKGEASLKYVYEMLGRIERVSPIPGLAMQYFDYLIFRESFSGPGRYFGREFSAHECYRRPWGEFMLYDLPKELETFNNYRKFNSENPQAPKIEVYFKSSAAPINRKIVLL